MYNGARGARGASHFTPPLLVAALRERELTFRNSKALHEAYFANLGGDGRRSDAIETGLARRTAARRVGRSTSVRRGAASAEVAAG